MHKKVICLFLIVFTMFSLSGCSDAIVEAIVLFAVITGDDRADKGEIINYVCENEEELLKAIDDGDFSKFENKGFIKEIDTDETVVDFSCGGAGIGSATSYVGFYYTPNNDMSAAWCAPPSGSELTKYGNGFKWQNGDDRYYVEHICGNFYYYEASF